jgi:hypothetical protein
LFEGESVFRESVFRAIRRLATAFRRIHKTVIANNVLTANAIDTIVMARPVGAGA